MSQTQLALRWPRSMWTCVNTSRNAKRDVATQLADETLFPLTLKRSWEQLLNEPSSYYQRASPRPAWAEGFVASLNLSSFLHLGSFTPFSLACVLWAVVSVCVEPVQTSIFLSNSWPTNSYGSFRKCQHYNDDSTNMFKYKLRNLSMVAIDCQGMPPLGGRVGFPLLCGFAFLSPPPPLLTSESGICFTYRTR